MTEQQELQHAADVTAIVQTLNSYMQAIDKSDTAALKQRVFADDGKMQLLDLVDVDTYCAFIKDIMTKIKTQHFLLNSIPEVDGNSASCTSYFIGYHRVPAGDQGEACAALFGRHEADIDSVIGGIYKDRLEKRDNGWRITERSVTLLWQQQGPTGQLMVPNWIA